MTSAQTPTENTRVTKNLPESLKSDTGHASRQHSSVHTGAETKCWKAKTSKEDIEQEVEAQYLTADAPEENTITQVRVTTYIAHFYRGRHDANQKR